MVGDFAFLKGNIETIILTALYNGDKYGFEIFREIKEKTENKFDIKEATLYSYIKRLEGQKLITSYWGNESLGGRRKYYKLTQEGKNLCEQFMKQWQLHRTVLDNLVTDKPIVLGDTSNELQSTVFLGSKQPRKRNEKKANLGIYQNVDNIAEKLDFLEVQRANTDSTPTTKITTETYVKTNQTNNDFYNAPIMPNYSNVKTNEIEEDINYNMQSSKKLHNTKIESDNERQYKKIIGDLVGDQLKAMPKSFAVKPEQSSSGYRMDEKTLTINELADSLLDQGIKVRIYNKVAANYRPPQLLRKTKINFCVSWIVTLFVALQMLLFWAVGSNYFEVDWRYLVSVVAIPLLFAIVNTTKILIDPKKKTKPRFDFGYSIGNALLTFGLIAVFVFLVNIWFIKIVFTNIKELLMQIVLPLIAAVNIPLSVLMYKLFYNKMIC